MFDHLQIEPFQSQAVINLIVEWEPFRSGRTIDFQLPVGGKSLILSNRRTGMELIEDEITHLAGLLFLVSVEMDWLYMNTDEAKQVDPTARPKTDQ
ncbi:hypothetical protein GCM10028805_07290 [Spirosoma harenae]